MGAFLEGVGVNMKCGLMFGLLHSADVGDFKGKKTTDFSSVLVTILFLCALFNKPAFSGVKLLNGITK